MKAKISLLTVLAALALLTNARGQGTITFQNLDFEAANVSGSAPGWVPIADALPGWNGYLISPYSGQFTEVLYNTVPLGDAEIILYDSGLQFPYPVPIPVLQGKYSVRGYPQYPSGLGVFAIGQVGTVPTTAKSVRFYARGPLDVSFAGQSMPLFLVSSTPNYNIYGADISPFANQTGELRFTGHIVMDNIFFSDQAIPEPGALSLLAIGASFLWLRRLLRDDKNLFPFPNRP